MATTVCKFSQIFRGSMPPGPLEPFFYSQYASKYFRRKKTRSKIYRNLVPPP